jgi:hypothetical protein
MGVATFAIIGKSPAHSLGFRRFPDVCDGAGGSAFR